MVEHTGKKYLKKIPTNGDGLSDIYDVLTAFNVTCPATAHAIKKLLMPGQRGKNTVEKDLVEARDAVSRAIELVEPQQPPVYGQVEVVGADKIPSIGEITDAMQKVLDDDPQPSIPDDVYWCQDKGHFFSMDTGIGMGAEFCNTWYSLREWFPTSPNKHPGLKDV